MVVIRLLDIEFLKTILIGWAKENKFVRKLWIYGSRAGKNYKPDSDLDIAIEIDPVKTHDTTPYTSFICDHKKWEKGLQKKIPYEVDLGHYNLEAPKGVVVRSVAQKSILVYIREDLKDLI